MVIMSLSIRGQCEHCQVFERPGRLTPSQSAEDMHHRGQRSIVCSFRRQNFVAENERFLDLLSPDEGEGFERLLRFSGNAQSPDGDSVTFTRLLFGSFLSSLLHVKIAVLFDPESMASGGGGKRA